MNSRTYQAQTMAEALAQVKRDMGRRAVILHTRSFRKGGFLGIGGRSMWEITASPHANVPQRIPSGRYVPDRAPASSGAAAPATCAEPEQAAVKTQPAAEPIGNQIGDIRRMVEALLAMSERDRADDFPDSLQDLRGHLGSQDVADEIADEIIGDLQASLTGDQLNDAPSLRKRLIDSIAARIPTASATQHHAGQARVIALVGPTGVGKTTTIAKLAADYKLREGRRVGLITIDTYRIAAVDQLRTYAEIIDIPLKVVLSAGELHEAVRCLKGLDVVLIDTAGRSQNDTLRINQLRSFLAAMHADEVHLVVSAAAGRKCAKATLENFLPLGANRIIVSKLDEAQTFGALLNVAVAGQTPLSYVTTGQDVPDDMAVADSNRLAELITEGGLHAY